MRASRKRNRGRGEVRKRGSEEKRERDEKRKWRRSVEERE